MIEIIKNEEIKDFLDILGTRGDIFNSPYQAIVDEIVLNVRKNKDQALFTYINKLDNPNLNKTNFIVTREEMKIGYDNLDLNLRNVIEKSYKRIYEFHLKEKRNSWLLDKSNGEILGSRITAIENVAIYVPGGKASYPSSILMNAIPAIIAGCKNIYMATPSKEEKLSDIILAAAYICNVKLIYKMGGAQAIAALAFGTESVSKVDKIVGPGNIFVALAKKAVFGTVSIDSIAGPSEICVVADSSANPKYIAADLLSQAEHDELASGVLITTSEELALKAQKEVENFVLNVLTRKEIINESIKNYCRIIVVNNMDEAIKLANIIAPEHLELQVENPFEILSKVENAGCIFMGYYSPESLGDYMAGSNHVLPTCQTARFFSPLGVDDFIKKSSLVNFSKEAFKELANDVSLFARTEGLDAHALAVEVRLND